MADLPLLLAHRGCRSLSSAPENSLPAFDLALEEGCDGFEFDVRLTMDGELVICHDPYVGKVCIAQSEYENLAHLPTLDQVLTRYGNRCFLNIELKVAGVETRILAAAREYEIHESCVISSFLPEVTLEIKVRSGLTSAGIICENRDQLDVGMELPVDCLMAEEALVDQDLVNSIHNAGKRLFVWTVNSAAAMLRVAGWGADGIISDDVRLLMQTLRPESLGRPQITSA